jgi:hypothetical protein
MIAAGSTVGCGMSLVIAVWSAEIQAEPALPPAKVQHFGERVVVIQPGSTAAKWQPAVVAPQQPRSLFQLASFGNDVPTLPPMPDIPEPAAISEPLAPATAEPATAEPAAAESPASASAPVVDPLELARKYREIYHAIPFDRSEHDANPSYRHEAALEILFGKMRPTVVNRNHTRVDVNLPELPYWQPYYGRYGFNSYYYPFYTPGYRVHRSW